MNTANDKNTNALASPGRQLQQSMPGDDEIKGVWKQQIGAARLTWGKLTDDELRQTEGRVQKLLGLVQERYAITHDEASAQINSFFDKPRS